MPLQRKYDHIKQARKKLHWLPVEYRINHKILLLANKAQPYTLPLLLPYKPGRSLQSEGKYLPTHDIPLKILANGALHMLPLHLGTH